MLHIHQLLNRFKNLSNSDKRKKQLITEIFEKEKIPVIIDQIKIVKNTVFIKTQPIIKTEILLKKESIIKKIKEMPGLAAVSSIL